MDKREQGLIYASEFDRILSDEDQEAELCDAAGISSNDLNDLTKLFLGCNDDSCLHALIVNRAFLFTWKG